MLVERLFRADKAQKFVKVKFSEKKKIEIFLTGNCSKILQLRNVVKGKVFVNFLSMNLHFSGSHLLNFVLF